MFVVLLGAFLASGCGFAGAGSLVGQQLVLGYLEWDENVANSTLIKVILEDELDYDEVDLKQAGDVRPAFRGVASGETDAFLDVWMPNHRALVAEVEDEVRLSREPWYTGQTEYGLAVPSYMEGVESIADLNDSGADMIIGIEPGAVLMQRISERVIPEYDLDLSLVQASTPAMLSELQTAYEMEEPIVFLAWSPHWMNSKYDFRYLQDPRNALGPLDEPARLLTVTREGFEEDHPVAYALIDAMRLDEKQMNTLELAINEVEDPEQGVRNWLEEGENQEAIRPWIEAAKRAQEG